MKLWLIERTDECDWDETCAVVVRAEDEAAARTQALSEVPDHKGVLRPAYYGFREDNITIAEVTPEGEPGVIIVDILRG